MGLERINEIRKAKNMSIDELCAKSGIPKSTISKITAGITTNPTLDTMQAIARALGCRLDDFDDLPIEDTKKAPPMEDGDEEVLNLYHRLDHDDRLTIKGEMRGMLLTEKYRKEEQSGNAAG